MLNSLRRIFGALIFLFKAWKNPFALHGKLLEQLALELTLIANENGEFDGISANYSGAGFTGMKFKATATSQADFEAWVNEVKQSPKQLDAAEYAALAKTSENNPVALYSVASPEQFQSIVDKYEGMNRGRPVHEKEQSKEAAGTEGMDVTMHSAAGAEE